MNSYYELLVQAVFLTPTTEQIRQKLFELYLLIHTLIYGWIFIRFYYRKTSPNNNVTPLLSETFLYHEKRSSACAYNEAKSWKKHVSLKAHTIIQLVLIRDDNNARSKSSAVEGDSDAAKYGRLRKPSNSTKKGDWVYISNSKQVFVTRPQRVIDVASSTLKKNKQKIQQEMTMHWVNILPYSSRDTSAP